MFCLKKKKCLFCVANEDFEHTKNVDFVYVGYDEMYVEDILEKCNTFWKRTIFNIVKKKLSILIFVFKK